jgi:tetratricopeptide (TPR) repeat protein
VKISALMLKNCLKPRLWGILALCWFLLGALPCLYAGGKQDSDLSRADKLIQEKKYDEAILILSEFSRRNPGRFDDAQQRFRQIYKIRGEFNTVADRLLDTLITDPDKDDEILALTRRLEELEDSTNPQLRTFITRTKELSLFNVNRQRLEHILAQGRTLLDQGNYQGALLAYAGGMDIYRNEFFAAGYAEDFVSQVNQRLANINTVVETFPAVSAPLGQAAQLMSRTVASETAPARLEEPYSLMVPAMDRFIELWQMLYASVSYFDRQIAELQSADPYVGDRNYLSFLSRLIHGRAGQQVEEGMLGALEGYWQSSVGAVENAISDKVDQVYSAGFMAATGGDYQAARSGFETAGAYTVYPEALYAKHFEMRAADPSHMGSVFGVPVLAEDAAGSLKFESLNQSLAYLIKGSELGARLEQAWGTMNAPNEQGVQASAVSLERERNFTVIFQSETGSVLEEIGEKERELRNYRDSLANQPDFNVLTYISDARSLIMDLRAQILDEGRQSAIRYYTIANEDLDRRLRLRQDELDEGTKLINGIARTSDEGVVIIDHFPSEGFAVLNRMTESLTNDIAQGNALLTRYSNEDQDVLANADVAALRQSAQTIMNRMNSLRADTLTLASSARNQIAQAEAFRLEGERLFRESQTALGRQDFTIARDRVQRAAERFNNSLAIQESASLRSTWDTQVVNLSLNINRIEDELIVRDVRNLVNNARDTYFAGNFEQAEDLLVRARNRWRVTRSERNEEVEYWLDMVRGALSLRSGREILPTAPLYPEMSQLLSEAKKNYEEGARYMNTGSRDNGIAKFTVARQKTREVKLMFPLNREAGLLELMMDRVTDPPAFDRLFTQRVRDAVAGTKRRSIESFAELQNLAEINPRYPNMAAIITQAEIDMGMRPPPPDPRALARSSELTSAARRIRNGNLTGQFEVALTQVNEAISLNPGNTEAQQIKDWLLTRLGAPTATVLNSQDEAEYQRAVMELQRRNYLVAMSIVQQLLQNPRNQNITKVLELQQRIQSAL